MKKEFNFNVKVIVDDDKLNPDDVWYKNAMIRYIKDFKSSIFRAIAADSTNLCSCSIEESNPVIVEVYPKGNTPYVEVIDALTETARTMNINDRGI